MLSRYIKFITILLCFSSLAYADSKKGVDVLSELSENSIPILNENFRRLDRKRFIDLKDTSDYAGEAGKAIVVNAAETGLTYATTAGVGTLTTIQENDVSVGDADIGTLDFDGSDFNLSEAPDQEVNVTINDAGIDHDATTNFVANEHIDWTNTASNFLTSGTLGSGALTCTTINTGTGARELDQDVISGATPTFTGTNITGIPAASILAGTFGTGAYVFDNTVTGITALDCDEIANVNGDLKIMPDVGGNIIAFGDTDVDNAADGKSFYVYRKAAEGDKHIQIYIDQFQQNIIGTDCSMQQFAPSFGVGGGITQARYNFEINNQFAGAGENWTLKHYGYITAAAAQKFIQNQINDATDNFELTRQDANILGFDIQMPFGSTSVSQTLGAGVTTFAITRNVETITGDGGGNTIATITGGLNGQLLTLIFTDALVVITDDNTHAANSVDLSAAFTSADDTVLQLVRDGTSWYEVGRSTN